MSRARAASMVAVAAAGVACVGVSGAIPGPAIPLCLAALAARLAPPFSRGLLLPARAVPLVLVALFVLTVLHAWGDFPRALLLFAAPFLVVRAFTPPSPYNDFVVVLLSLLAMVASVAVAPGYRPLVEVAGFLAVLGLALPQLVRPERPPSRAVVRIRMERPPGAWRAAAPAAALLVSLSGILLGTLLYLAFPRSGGDDAEDAPVAERSRRAREARRLGSRGGEQAIVTGLSDRSRLGSGGFVRDDDRLALVAFVARDAVPYDPPASARMELCLRADAGGS